MKTMREVLAVGVILAGGLGAPALATTAVAETSADNSARNERDRSGSSLTPEDQGTSKQDVTITQEIRKEVVANDSLSVNAKNVKIITVDGFVTLRGPVKSEGEKTTILALASRTPGVRGVNSQLEIER
jgi:osmotically-inducible protein OsmY